MSEPADTIAELPVLPHIASEFYAWLWWASEQRSSGFDLPAPVGKIDVWVDERLAFRSQNEAKVCAVMTGENASTTPEARAALAGGRVLQELRVGIRRDDREYLVTLKGPAMNLQGIKLPQVLTESADEVIFDRMHLYEELTLVVGALFRAFADLRVSPAWEEEVLPALREWVLGQ